ncbi:hypothetical protein GZH82_00330 [Staphylococcus ursi]|nr:hypothetical protein [Staphylococcus sp. MI 10-1553]QHW35938.1 hypothetical protein GZH82_00330 [Staphylococcus sp. MI 10-1553]
MQENGEGLLFSCVFYFEENGVKINEQGNYPEKPDSSKVSYGKGLSE